MSVCLCVCLCVNHDTANHNRYTGKLDIAPFGPFSGHFSRTNSPRTTRGQFFRKSPSPYTPPGKSPKKINPENLSRTISSIKISPDKPQNSFHRIFSAGKIHSEILPGHCPRNISRTFSADRFLPRQFPRFQLIVTVHGLLLISCFIARF